MMAHKYSQGNSVDSSGKFVIVESEAMTEVEQNRRPPCSSTVRNRHTAKRNSAKSCRWKGARKGNGGSRVNFCSVPPMHSHN